MNNTADLEQGINVIASQPGSCQATLCGYCRAEDRVHPGPEFAWSLRVTESSELATRTLVTVELCDFSVIIFIQKYKDRFAHRNLISVVQSLFRNGASVDECSVAAFEVANFVAVLIAAEQAMASRKRKIADGERVRWDPVRSGLLNRSGNRWNLLRGPRLPGVWVSRFVLSACIPFITIREFLKRGK